MSPLPAGFVLDRVEEEETSLPSGFVLDKEQSTPDPIIEPEEPQRIEASRDLRQQVVDPAADVPEGLPEEAPPSVAGTFAREAGSRFQTKSAGVTAGIVQGVAQTARGILFDLPRQVAWTAIDIVNPGAYERWVNKQAVKNPAVLKEPNALAYWTGPLPTAAQTDAAEQFQDDLHLVLRDSGMPAAFALQASEALFQTGTRLAIAKGVTGALPGGLTGPGMGWKATLAHSGKFAGFTWVSTQGTPEKKTRAAMIAFLYVGSPAASMNAPTNSLAVLSDFFLNSGITVATGAYKDALEQARIMAEAQGEDWSTMGNTEKAGFIALTVTPLAVNDLYFSLRTRSSRIANDPALRKIVNDVEGIEKGTLSPERAAELDRLTNPEEVAKSQPKEVEDIAPDVKPTPREQARADAESEISELVGERVIHPSDNPEQRAGQLGFDFLEGRRVVANLKEDGLSDKEIVDVLDDLAFRQDKVAKDRVVSKLEVQRQAEEARQDPDVRAELIAERGGGEKVTEPKVKERDVINALGDVLERSGVIEKWDGYDNTAFNKGEGFTVSFYSSILGRLGSGRIDPEHEEINIAAKGRNIHDDLKLYNELVERVGDKELVDSLASGLHKLFLQQEPPPPSRATTKSTKDQFDQAIKRARQSLPERGGIEQPAPDNKYQFRVEQDLVNEPSPLAPDIEIRFSEMVERVNVSTIKDQQKNALLDGMERGAAYLRHVRNFSPENADAIIDQMARGEEQGGVRGIGPSTATILKAIANSDSTEDAYRTINDWRAANGKDLLEQTPITLPKAIPPEGVKPSELPPPPSIPKGPVELNHPRYVHPTADVSEIRQSMPWKKLGGVKVAGEWQTTDLSEEAFNAAIDQLNFPLPTDQRSRSMHIKRIIGEARAYYDYRIDSSNVITEGWRKSWQNAKMVGSRRYMDADIFRASGRDDLQTADTELEHASSRGRFESETRLNNIKSVAINSGLKPSEIESEPDKVDAIKTILFIDPKIAADDKKLRARLKDAFKEVGEWNENNPWKKVHDALRDEIQGPSATSVRVLQLYEWMKVFNKNGPLIESLESEKELSNGKKAYLRSLKKELDNASPFMAGDDGKPSHVPVGDLQEAAIVWRDQGPEAARTFLSRQKWGTRKFYWMSENENDFATKIFQKFTEKPVETGGTPQAGVSAPGEINPRLGMAEPAKGDLFNSIGRHMHRLEVMSRGLPQAEKILEGINSDTRLPNWLRESATRGVKNALGFHDPGGPISQTANWVKRHFFRFAALNPQFAAFFNGRNLPQSWMLGLTQYRADQMISGNVSFLKEMRKPHSWTRKVMANVFKQEVSMQSAIFREQLGEMLGPEGAFNYTGKLGPVNAAIDGWSKIVFGGVDTSVNRKTGFGVGLQLAREASQSFIRDGQLTDAQLNRRLWISSLHPMEQGEIWGLWNKAKQSGNPADFDKFTIEYAQKKNLNMNFGYHVSQRSGLEQWGEGRAALQVYTWNKGAAEIFIRNGTQTVKEGFRTGDASKVWQGLEVIGMYTIMMYTGGAIAAQLLGRKGKDSQLPVYHPLHSALYSPYGLGVSAYMAVADMYEFLTTIDQEDPDFENIMRKVGKHIDAGQQIMLPTLNILPKLFAAAGNTEAQSNSELLIDIITGLHPDGDLMERDFINKAQLILVGTQQTQQSRKKVLWDTFLPSRLIIDEPFD